MKIVIYGPFLGRYHHTRIRFFHMNFRDTQTFSPYYLIYQEISLIPKLPCLQHFACISWVLTLCQKYFSRTSCTKHIYSLWQCNEVHHLPHFTHENIEVQWLSGLLQITQLVRYQDYWIAGCSICLWPLLVSGMINPFHLTCQFAFQWSNLVFPISILLLITVILLNHSLFYCSMRNLENHVLNIRDQLDSDSDFAKREHFFLIWKGKGSVGHY
jgi:hypothetical protein